MFYQIKKTFLFTQIMIVGLTIAVFYGSHGDWQAAAMVFLTTQLGSVTGAWWGARLRRRIAENATAARLRRT